MIKLSNFDEKMILPFYEYFESFPVTFSSNLIKGNHLKKEVLLSTKSFKKIVSFIGIKLMNGICYIKINISYQNGVKAVFLQPSESLSEIKISSTKKEIIQKINQKIFLML